MKGMNPSIIMFITTVVQISDCVIFIVVVLSTFLWGKKKVFFC